MMDPEGIKERVGMLSIHPDAATRDDVARMAAELMAAEARVAELEDKLCDTYESAGNEHMKLLARAEAAEARVKALEKALRNIKGMAESDDGDYCMIYDAAKAALRGKVGCKQRPVEKAEDPRDDPITGDDSWVHDPDMGDR